MKKAISIIALLLAILCVFSGCSSSSNAYPSKNIDLTVLFTAGSSADLGVRKLADIIEKTTDAKFVVNNRTGGGGSVGYQYILNQSADGYNICWNSTSISTVYHNGNMSEGQDYTAFKAVCGLTIEPSIIAVSADSPYQTFEDFYNDAKARPGEVKVLMGSIGSFDHLCAASFAKASGLDLNACHDNGSIVTPLLGNQVDVSISIAASFLPQIQAGSCRALAVQLEKRSQALKTLYLDKVAGIISEGQFVELNKSFLNEKSRLEQRLGKIDEELEAREQPQQQADLMEKACELLKLETIPRELVVGLVEKIEIGEKHVETGRQNVTITWKF